MGFSDDAALMLQTYSYPGNVRELENMIERAVLMASGRAVMPVHLPMKIETQPGESANHSEAAFLNLPFHKAVAELEKVLIKQALLDAEGNKTAAADRLQINRRLLYKKIIEHQVEE